MKKKWILTGMAAVLAAVALSTSVYAATTEKAQSQTQTEQTVQTESCRERGGREKIDEPENAVGKDAAKDAALKDAGITADQATKVKARLSKTEDGTVVYKVGITVGEQYYSYQIDAVSGQVVNKTAMTVEEREAQKPQGKHGKKEKVDEPENAVGKDAAKETALKDAGITADQATKVKARLSKTEDGTVIYKVGITVGEQYYSYQIDAVSGEVLNMTTMTVEEHEAAKAQGQHGQEKLAQENSSENGKAGGHRGQGGPARSSGNESSAPAGVAG